MSNLPEVFGQLPIDSLKSLVRLQKQNAGSVKSCAYELVLRRQIKKLDQFIDDTPLSNKWGILKSNLNQIKKTFQITHKHYSVVLAIDILILVIAITLGVKPAVKLISPWVEQFQQNTQIVDPNLKNHKLFAFVPGWSSNKLAKVNLDGLSTLAFFDLPVNQDGTLNLDNTGYQNFKNDVAADLFQRAHQKGIKVVVALTQIDNNEIAKILNDSDAQQNVISQSIKEIKDSPVDGIALDFEYSNGNPSDLKDRYSQFVKNFSDQMHQQIPGSLVTVAIPNSLSNQSIYDTAKLASFSDKILMIVYDTAVPETKNASIISPIFASDAWSYPQENSVYPQRSSANSQRNSVYFQKLSFSMGNFSNTLPADKVQMESAWYGNGNAYPLYTPKDQPSSVDNTTRNTLKTPLTAEVINNLISEVPDRAKSSARKNLPFIAKALEDEGILNENVLAYAMATIEHETASTFEPIEEIKGRKSARRLGYEGGTDYFGRGFIQLTHLRNYKKIGQRIGLGDQLVQDPELASKTEVAAKVLAAFFKDNNVANLASNGNFVAARDPINPDYWAYSIARLAWKYLYSIG